MDASGYEFILQVNVINFTWLKKNFRNNLNGLILNS